MSVTQMPDGSVPANYTEVLHWKIGQQGWRVIAINLIALPLAAVFAAISIGVLSLTGLPAEIKGEITLPGLLAVLVGVVLTLPAHELAHGLAMRAYGARAEYGFTPAAFAFYATAPGYAFRRNHYLLVLLAPLVCLNVLFYLAILLLPAASFPALLLAICALVNGGSAAGDLWMSVMVLRYPASAYIIDERDGMRVFLPGGDPA